MLDKLVKALLPLSLLGAITCCQAPSATLNDGLDGYKTLVDKVLIGKRIIRTTAAGATLDGAREPGSEPLVMIDEVRLTQPDLDDLREHIRDYLRLSSITGDIARNDPARWKIDNSLIEMNNPTGKFLSPFAFSEWTGRLLFADSKLAGRWVARIGEGEWKPVSALQSTATNHWKVSPCTGNCQFEILQSTARNSAGEIRLTLEDGGRAKGSHTYCGSQTLIPRGRNTKGICLQLDGDGQAELQLIYLTASMVISPDSEAQTGMRLASLASSVRSARSTWVQNGCGGNCATARDTEIRTTLNRKLTIFAQDALDRIYDQGPKPMQRAAGVTIMDARSGAILALASRDRTVETAPPGLLSREDPNFIDLPIGSVAKPLVASAIYLDQHRKQESWNKLEVSQDNASSKVESLFGVELDSPFKGDSVGDKRWLGSEEFIARSSNYYAAALMLLSCKSERGELRKWDAANSVKGVANARPCTRDAAETNFTLPWLNAFSDSYGPIGSTKNLALWGAGEEANGFMPHHTVFPWLERSTHRENEITVASTIPLRSFRSNLLPIILGGQEYRWSSVLVAQSFGRLVTGTNISATLVSPAGSAGNIAIGNRTALLNGLARVLASGGTAAELSSAFSGYIAYAKTGTPEIEVIGSDAPKVNQRILENYDGVAELIPSSLRGSNGWQTFDKAGFHYRMFDGRIVSASRLGSRTYFAKTFVFFICKPEQGSIQTDVNRCGNQRLVVYITTQDPYEEYGNNPALAITRRLLHRESSQAGLSLFQLSSSDR